MKIKLIRTGGFIPITKAVEAEVNLTDKELNRLIKSFISARLPPGSKMVTITN